MDSDTINIISSLQDEEYNLPYHWMYDKNLQRLYSLRNEISLELIGELKDMKVLDFGCGDGKFTSLLTEKTLYVNGVDISSHALRFARCLVPEANFSELNGNQLPFPDNNFDIVCCLDVFEHIPPVQINFWIKEIQRIMKKNGKLVFSVPSILKNTDAKHFQHFTVRKLEELLGNYFTDFHFKGYFLKLSFMHGIVDKLYNKGTIWKIFTPLIRKCALSRALYMAGICYKKK